MNAAIDILSARRAIEAHGHNRREVCNMIERAIGKAPREWTGAECQLAAQLANSIAYADPDHGDEPVEEKEFVPFETEPPYDFDERRDGTGCDTWNGRRMSAGWEANGGYRN